MNTDNTQGGAEPSPASDGSHGATPSGIPSGILDRAAASAAGWPTASAKGAWCKSA